MLLTQVRRFDPKFQAQLFLMCRIRQLFHQSHFGVRIDAFLIWIPLDICGSGRRGYLRSGSDLVAISSREDNLWLGPARLLAVRARLRAWLDEPDTHELRIELVGGSMRSDWRRALWAFGRTRHPSRRRHPKLQVFRRLLVGAEDHSGPHGGGSVLNTPRVHHPRADLVRRRYRERQMAAARARAPGGITHRVGG